MTRTRTDRPCPAVAGPALTHGWVRLARAGVLGGLSLVLATAGHAIGGGTLPGAGLLLLVGVALALVAVSLTARRLRFSTLLAVLATEQLVLHLLFHASTTVATCAPVTMPGHTMAAVCGGGSATSGGWSMLVGHVLAVAATAWLLARGERWLWRAVDRVHRWATTRPTRLRRPRVRVVATHRAAVSGPRWLLAGPRAPPPA